MDWVSLIISLVSGAVGGNVAGALMKAKSLGTLGNSIAGIAGGAGLGAILQQLGIGGPAAAGATGGGMDLMSILGSVLGGGAGGGILMAIIAAIKGAKK